MKRLTMKRLMMNGLRSGEDGIAMVTVLLVTMILLLVVSGTMAYALGSQPLSKRDQNWNAALSAAEAGLDDYLFRLNENDQYYLYSTTNPPPDGNQAFTTWVSVPNSGNAASMRYTVDTTNLSAQGAIILTATGRVGNVTSSVQATIRRHAFIDYLYFTDYETTDPAAYPNANNSNNAAWAQTNCAKHWYDPRVRRPPLRQQSLRRPQLRLRRHDQRAAVLQRRHLGLRESDLHGQRHNLLGSGLRQQVPVERRRAATLPRSSRVTRGMPIP